MLEKLKQKIKNEIKLTVRDTEVSFEESVKTSLIL